MLEQPETIAQATDKLRVFAQGARLEWHIGGKSGDWRATLSRRGWGWAARRGWSWRDPLGAMRRYAIVGQGTAPTLDVAVQDAIREASR